MCSALSLVVVQDNAYFLSQLFNPEITESVVLPYRNMRVDEDLFIKRRYKQGKSRSQWSRVDPERTNTG